MKLIGVLFGEERTFPPALVEHINVHGGEMRAESVQVGAVTMAEWSRYDVILDRISHDVPFFGSMLRNAMLSGTRVVNNPFSTFDADKFFSYALMQRMGIPVPRTVVFPSKTHPPGTSSASMRNLVYPIDWRAAFDYVGFPAYLKPNVGMGGKHVYRIESEQEFFESYDQTGCRAMLLQEAIEFSEYYRCYVIGQRYVRIMPYEPRNPHARRYEIERAPNRKLRERLSRYCLAIVNSLGYECNSIEFAVREGVPYAIDYLNGAPDAELASVRADNFRWFIEHMAAYLMHLAMLGRTVSGENGWTRLIAGGIDQPAATERAPAAPRSALLHV
jgi:glutathione synthase/RimK-type ligase-like ATP-grasp enzyme